jgi:hypothetical protein
VDEVGKARSRRYEWIFAENRWENGVRGDRGLGSPRSPCLPLESTIGSPLAREFHIQQTYVSNWQGKLLTIVEPRFKNVLVRPNGGLTNRQVLSMLFVIAL